MPLTTLSGFDYRQWLPQWQRVSCNTPSNAMLLPPKACKISTPLNVSAWSIYLWTHPHQDLAQFYVKGITEVFRIGFTYHSQCLKSARRNLESARDHPEVVKEYLKTEVHMGRLIGPLDNSYKLLTHKSRFGVIPKSHQINKW